MHGLLLRDTTIVIFIPPQYLQLKTTEILRGYFFIFRDEVKNNMLQKYHKNRQYKM